MITVHASQFYSQLLPKKSIYRMVAPNQGGDETSENVKSGGEQLRYTDN